MSTTGTAPGWVNEISLAWGTPAISHSDPIAMGSGINRYRRRTWTWLLGAGLERQHNYGVHIDDHGSWHGVVTLARGPKGVTEFSAGAHGAEPDEAQIRAACLLSGLPVLLDVTGVDLATRLADAEYQHGRAAARLAHVQESNVLLAGRVAELKAELALVPAVTHSPAASGSAHYCGAERLIEHPGRWPKPGTPPAAYICLGMPHGEDKSHDWRRVGYRGRENPGSVQLDEPMVSH